LPGSWSPRTPLFVPAAASLSSELEERADCTNLLQQREQGRGPHSLNLVRCNAYLRHCRNVKSRWIVGLHLEQRSCRRSTPRFSPTEVPLLKAARVSPKNRSQPCGLTVLNTIQCSPREHSIISASGGHFSACSERPSFGCRSSSLLVREYCEVVSPGASGSASSRLEALTEACGVGGVSATG